MTTRISHPNRTTPVELTNGSDFDSFPGSCKRHNGDYVVTYRSSTDHNIVADGDLMMQVSTDKGATWGAATTLQDAAATHDYRESHMFRLPTADKLIVVYTSVVVASGHDSTNEIRVITSTDDGATWGSPVTIDYSGQGDGYGIMTNPPIRLLTGRLLLGIRVEDAGDTYDNSHIYYSDDDGATWAWLSKAGDGDASSRMLAEPALVQMPSGDIACFMRDAAAQESWYAVSGDEGYTWTTPAKALDTSGTNNCALHGNRIWMFGRSDNSGIDDAWIYWTTEDRLDDGEWSGPLRFTVTDSGETMNHGALLVDGDDLYGVWSESQTASDADLYFGKIASLLTTPRVVMADSFNRADSASLGYCDGGSFNPQAAGYPWTVSGPGTGELRDNVIRNLHSSQTEDVRLLNTGIELFDLSVLMKSTDSYIGLEFCQDSGFDDGYFLQLRGVDGEIQLYRVDGGSNTELYGVDHSIAADTFYRLRVRVDATTITIWLDGTLITTVTDATHRGIEHTNIGWLLDDQQGNYCEFDDPVIAAIPAAVTDEVLLTEQLEAITETLTDRLTAVRARSLDYVPFVTAILSGEISNAGTSTEQYDLTLDGIDYRAAFTGLDSVGNRSGVTLSKP